MSKIVSKINTILDEESSKKYKSYSEVAWERIENLEELDKEELKVVATKIAKFIGKIATVILKSNMSSDKITGLNKELVYGIETIVNMSKLSEKLKEVIQKQIEK